MTEKDYINFSANVIKLIKDDIEIDKELQQYITNAVIYELRHWRIPTKRGKTMEPVEKDDSKREIAYELFNQGLTNSEVQKQLNMSGFSIWNYRRDWRSGAKTMKKTVAWYKEQYPNLHDALYQALADGRVDESIIRRNTW